MNAGNMFKTLLFVFGIGLLFYFMIPDTKANEQAQVTMQNTWVQVEIGNDEPIKVAYKPYIANLTDEGFDAKGVGKERPKRKSGGSYYLMDSGAFY